MANVTARDTKSVIFAAYQKLTRDYSKLKTENKSLSTQATRRAAAPAAKAPAAKAPAAKAPAAPTDISGILSALETLRGSFADSTGTLQGKLTAEASRLSAIRETAAFESARIIDLYDMEITDDTLDTLLSTYQNQSDAFEAAMEEKQEVSSQEMAASRKTWRKEQETRNLNARERDSDLKKARRREQDEYTYDLNLRRKIEFDTYAQSQKTLQAALVDTREAQEKTWTEREESVAKAETEFIELKAKVEAFPAGKKSAVSRAAAEGAAIARRQAKIAADMTKKENEGRRRVFELQIKSLEISIAKNNHRIEALTTQLTTAQARAQDLAVKAIEGASNERSFKAIKEIAMEQAKTPTKGK
jgi:hypothetical protein